MKFRAGMNSGYYKMNKDNLRALPEYHMKTLMLFTSEFQANVGVLRISDIMAEELLSNPTQSVLVIKDTQTKIDGEDAPYLLYYCKSAELDFNGQNYYLRFEIPALAVAQYPGTTMFEENDLEMAIVRPIIKDIFIHDYRNTKYRQTVYPVTLGKQARDRLAGYTKHLDIKDTAIAERDETIAKHRAIQGKDFWIWEDDTESNHLESLTCPILIMPNQLRALLNGNN